MSKQSEFTRCLMSEIGRGRKYRDEEPMMIAKQRCLDKGDTKNIMRFTQELLDTAYDAGKAKDFQDNQWLYNSAHDTRKELHKYLNVEGFRKALLSQIGDVDRDNETFTEYEARIKAGIKRDLSPTQERQLLSYHATGDFEYGATNLRETMRVLMEQGYAKENKNRQFEITPKGVEYLDEHSLAIRSGNNPKSKEMTQYEKRKLQEQLERYDTMVKESKKTEKKITERGGQMTLFGKRLGFTKRDAAEAMTHEYAAFMRKLQDTALDLIDKSPADRAKIERFKGDVKIISATNAPTYKQAREMIYPNLDYIFYEIIDELSPNFRTSENLRNIQSEIIYRQEKYTPPATTSKKMPNEPTQRKAEKKIAEKGGQMTLFGRMVARKIAMRA